MKLLKLGLCIAHFAAAAAVVEQPNFQLSINGIFRSVAYRPPSICSKKSPI